MNENAKITLWEKKEGKEENRKERRITAARNGGGGGISTSVKGKGASSGMEEGGRTHPSVHWPDEF
jgi:hypothetical protein